MRKSSVIITTFFVFCLLNIALFLLFNVYVSKRYILASADDLSQLISEGDKVVWSIKNTSSADLQFQLIQTIKDNSTIVVSIFSNNSNAAKKLLWSWIIWTKDWLIVTNKHVVSDLTADYEVVWVDGQVYVVTNIWRDPLFDIAVLQVLLDNWVELDPAEFIDFADIVEAGEFVVTIGNSYWEYQDSASFWIISWKKRYIENSNQMVQSIWYYQTDATMSVWSSWWPLLDLDGHVIWVNTANATNSNWIWFALPVSQQFVDSLFLSIWQFNAIERVDLGLEYRDINERIAWELLLDNSIVQGAYISSVEKGSLAEKVGLMVWDIIVKVNGQSVDSHHSFMLHIMNLVAKDEVEIELLQWWKRKTLKFYMEKNM